MTPASGPLTLTTTPAAATLPGPTDRPAGRSLRALAWLRTLDPVALLCAVVAAAVYLLRGLDGPLSRDLGVYAYGGQQVADGVPPYVAILNRAGPLAHLVPGLGAGAARLVGVDDLRGMRVLFLLLSVGAVVALYLLGRDLFGSRAAGITAAAALLSFQGFTVYATNGPREKTAMVLLLALALLAMVHRRWGTSGAMIALGTLTWQPVFFPAIAVVGLAALLGRGRLSALLRIAVGGAVPTVVIVVGYAAIGRLQLFLDDFVLINARYTDQTSMVGRPRVLWGSLSGAYGWSVWVIGVGLVTLVALAVVAAARRGRHEPRNAAVAGLGLGVLVCAAWSTVAFNGWPDAYVALPFAAVGLAGLVPLLAHRLPPRAVTGVAVTWAVAASVLTAAYCVHTRTDVLLTQRAEGFAVMRELPADAEVVSIKAPQTLMLLHRRNPTRLQLFGNGLTRYVNDTWPGGTAGYGRWIGERAPAVVLVGADHTPLWIGRVLDESYVFVGDSRGQVRWYLHRDVPHERRVAIKAALRGG